VERLRFAVLGTFGLESGEDPRVRVTSRHRMMSIVLRKRLLFEWEVLYCIVLYRSVLCLNLSGVVVYKY